MSDQPLNAAPATHTDRTDPYRVIEAIKRLAVEQLGSLPSTLFDPIEAGLKAASVPVDGQPPSTANLGTQLNGTQLNYQNQAALWVLRQHQATHVMRFRQQIAQGFDDFRALQGRGRNDPPLGLIDEKQLEFHLAGQRLSETVEQRYQQPLRTMEGGMRALATVLGVPPALNPVGANRLAAAFIETFEDEDIPEALRLKMFQQYEEQLVQVLGQLYQRVNELLAGNGYRVREPMARKPSPGEPRRDERQPLRPLSARDDRNYGQDSGPRGESRAGHEHGQVESGRRDHDPHGHAPREHDYREHDYREHGDRARGHHEEAHRRESRQRTGSDAHRSSAGRSWSESRPPLDEVSQAEIGELRTLLRAWREGGLAAEDTGTASRAAKATAPLTPPRELLVEELVSVASLLQAEPADVFARALAGTGRLADIIREQLNDGSRRLGLDPDQTRFSAIEEDAIDLVALLFDSLFQNHHMQERSRRLYARLVLPFVKVALSDASMFVQAAHPARRLFDAITEACAGNNAETPQERELLDRAAAAAQKVVVEYNEDLAIFETAYAELDALLQQQRRRIELQEDRAAKATWGRERLNHARQQADALLAKRLSAPAVSRAVADFLATPWRHHLVQTLLRDGAEPARHAEAIALGDALVAADRLAGENRGRELADRLLEMQPAITDCLASSGLDESAARHGMALLVKAFAYPDTPRDLHQPPAARAEVDEVAEESAIWLGEFANAADGVAADGADHEGRPSTGLDPALVQRMQNLQAGDWVQMTDVHGDVTEAKVAWASPLSSRRLLVNRRGLRILVATAKQLAAMAADGRLQPSVDRTAFDQALQFVRKRLDREAGTP